MKFAWLYMAFALVPVFGYIWAPRTWVPGELVTASMMNGLRDILNAIHSYFFPTQTFRGLVMSTSPDQDLVQHTVLLEKADEIVMQDGERIPDWSNKTASIAASGAGGLDSGVEAASTWYELHAIRKSTDGTSALMFHKAKSYGADQSFVTTPNTERYLRLATATATDKIAQSIQFTASGLVELIEVQLKKLGSPSGRVWFTIEADAAGVPSGTPLATSAKINAAALAAAHQLVLIEFRTPFSVVAATTYHLVLQGDYTRSDTAAIGWSGVIAGGYTEGVSRDYNGTVWAATPGASGLDRTFSLYVTVPSAALTMPSGYDQNCLLGHIYNSASSHLIPTIFRDRKVMRNAVVAVNAGSSATPSLVALDAVIPPIPVLLDNMQILSTSSGATGSVQPTFENLGQMYFSTPVANYTINLAVPVPVARQRVYWSVSAGALTLQIRGYSW